MGGGFNNALSEARLEIEALGDKWITDLFDHQTRCLLRSVGFYQTPIPLLPRHQLQTIVELRENNRLPSGHQCSIPF